MQKPYGSSSKSINLGYNDQEFLYQNNQNNTKHRSIKTVDFQENSQDR